MNVSVVPQDKRRTREIPRGFLNVSMKMYERNLRSTGGCEDHNVQIHVPSSHLDEDVINPSTFLPHQIPVFFPCFLICRCYLFFYILSLDSLPLDPLTEVRKFSLLILEFLD